MVGELTFLLGAGFSKAFGGPLVSELSDIVSEPPKKIIDPLKFELVDLASLHDGYNYNITSNNKLRYSVDDFISFFNIYKSLLVSEYLKVYYCLPSYEALIGQMTKDTLLFDPMNSNYDFNNELRKNNIIRLGNFIKSGVGFEEKYYNLILNCIDYITLLVFDRNKNNS